MRADRLLQIVSLLRAHGQLSTTDLARRLEVTPRTVLRDMEALSSAGVPVYAERGRQGGFALLPGYRPAVEELTAREIEALLLSGTGAVDQMGLSATLSSALRKVSGAVAPELNRAADRVSERVLVDPGGWWSEPEELPWFGTVQQAVLTDRRLRVRYRPRNATTAGIRTLDPYGLVEAGGTWYLLAAHRARPRTYRIGRIEAAEVLAEASARPPDLDLRAVWHQLRRTFVGRPSMTVRLEILDRRPHEATIMLAGVGSGRPRLTDGPPMVLEVEVLGLRAAVAAIAGLGDRVRVLDPPELVEQLVASLAAARDLYQDTEVGALA